MKSLDKLYADQIEAIGKLIQDSDALVTYLDSEEDEDYDALVEKFEPSIKDLYVEVAHKNPLQLIAFEEALLNESLEGLFLPRILGYAILRGELNDNLRFVRPQNHFKDILLYICASPNFDQIKKRIGQTVQYSFALSSDIWISNLLNEINNKKVRQYLEQPRKEDFRDLKKTQTLINKYRLQFKDEDFQCVFFPTTLKELILDFSLLKDFVYHRIVNHEDNKSIMPSLNELALNESFIGTQEHFELTILYAMFFELDAKETKALKAVLDSLQEHDGQFKANFMDFYLRVQNSKLIVNKEVDNRIAHILKGKKKSELDAYFELVGLIHDKGIFEDEVVEATSKFYNTHEGRSRVNTAVRNTVFFYLEKILVNLSPAEYKDLFEIAKIYPAYMQIFNSQKFSQALRELNLKYIKKIIKAFPDKRGRDYQDVKKFVTHFFVELEFLTPKQNVELFKTKRKKVVKKES